MAPPVSSENSFRATLKTLAIILVAVLLPALFAMMWAAPGPTRESANPAGGGGSAASRPITSYQAFVMPSDLPKTEAEWRRKLTPEQYYILREKGTERPFSSPLDRETRPGTYLSADCGEPVFRSEQKYDSGTGWPSFTAPISGDAVILAEDDSLPLESRVEVLSKCGGHLGHVFNDGPPPTGKRYCMNGDALIFVADPPGNGGSQP